MHHPLLEARSLRSYPHLDLPCSTSSPQACVLGVRRRASHRFDLERSSAERPLVKCFRSEQPRSTHQPPSGMTRIYPPPLHTRSGLELTRRGAVRAWRGWEACWGFENRRTRSRRTWGSNPRRKRGCRIPMRYAIEGDTYEDAAQNATANFRAITCLSPPWLDLIGLPRFSPRSSGARRES